MTEQIRETPAVTRRTRARRIKDPHLRALKQFATAVEPLKKQERDALIQWLVDRFDVQITPQTWRR